MNKKIKFNQKIKNLQQASSIYWNQIAHEKKSKNKNFVRLSLGEAFLRPKKINLNKYTSEENFHYSDSKGSIELRKKIANYYFKKHNVKINFKNEILISAGSKILTYMSMLTLLNKNDTVYTFEPAWLSYEEQAKIIGNKLKFIPHDTQISKLNKKIDKHCKIFILNNPNNPSGKLYSKKFLLKLLEILFKRNITVLCDEAYSEFLNKDFIFSSIIEFSKYRKNIILVNSFSKNFSMSGWRVGYVISNKEIIDKMLVLNQHLITCAPTILQNIISKNFDNLLRHNKKQIEKLMEKRIIIKKELTKNNIEFIDGNSTFYFFIKVPKKINVDKLCNFLLHKKNISLVPGRAYGAKTKNYIRISIGTENERKIKKFIILLSKICKGSVKF